MRKVCEWIWNGEIGEVRRVDTFTDRPIWPQGLARPEEDMRIPKTMNWDSFIGPAPYRPYMITVGSDGHKAEHYAWEFDKAEDILRDAGFKYYAVFLGRKPEFIRI